MKKIKFIITWVLGALGYAFVSFYLVTPVLRKNPAGLLVWGIVGFLFAAFFLLTSSLFPRSNSRISYAIKGMSSSILACSFFGGFTYYNAVIKLQREGMIVLSNVKTDVIAALANYFLGFALLGLFAGVMIYMTRSDS